MILVKNAQSRIASVRIKVGVDGQGNDRVERVVFHPGINEAPANWADLKKHPLVAAALEGEKLVEIDTAPKPGAKSPDDLTGVSERRAMQIVKETIQPVLLQKWLNAEKRNNVIKAIGEQLDAIDPAKDPGKAK
ncbi:MAG: hypothetical protein KGR26_05540 [Cyanobacteria bacterium REEB65]|nr:hypothetical protein [Cyanobacteria bacterium REEB65]